MGYENDNIGAPLASAPSNGTGCWHRHRRGMMMHMTFFWGRSAEVLFTGWPGFENPTKYALSLLFVFVLAFLVEWLSHCRIIKPATKGLAPPLLRTFMYTIRSGLSYLVMLATMSFNGGVFLAALGGHALGFLFFGSRAQRKTPPDLPHMACG